MAPKGTPQPPSEAPHEAPKAPGLPEAQDPVAAGIARDMERHDKDEKKKEGTDAREQLTERIIKEKLDALTSETGKGGKDLDFADDSVVKYMVDEARAIFERLPDVPTELINQKKEWMAKFNDIYVAALNSHDTPMFNLKIDEVRASRDIAVTKMPVFEDWLQSTYPNKFDIFKKFNDQVVADKKKVEDDAKKAEADQKAAEVATKKAGKFREDNKDKINELSKKLATLKGSYEGYTMADAQLAAATEQLAKASKSEELAAVEATLSTLDNKDWITKLTTLRTNVATLKAVASDIATKIGEPEYGAGQVASVEQTISTVTNEDTFTAATKAYEKLNERMTKMQKLADHYAEAAPKMTEADRTALLEKIKGLDDETDPASLDAEVTAKGKAQDDAIEAEARQIEPTVMDKLTHSVDGMKDGQLKTMLAGLVDLFKGDAFKSFIGFLGGIPVLGPKIAKNFMTTEERIAANDPDIIFNTNMRRHMIKEFKLPKELIDKFTKARTTVTVEQAIELCGPKAAETDKSGKYIPQLNNFAETLKKFPLKDEKGNDTLLINVMGNPEQKEFDVFNPATAPAVAPATPAEGAAPAVADATTGTPNAPASGTPDAPKAAPAAAVAGAVAGAAAGAGYIAGAPTAQPGTKPAAPAEAPKAPAENLQAQLIKAMNDVLKPMQGKEHDIEHAGVAFNLPYIDNNVLKYTPVALQGNRMTIGARAYNVKLPHDATFQKLKIEGTGADGTATMVAGKLMFSQSKEMPLKDLVATLNVLRTGKSPYTVKADGEDVTFEIASSQVS